MNSGEADREGMFTDSSAVVDARRSLAAALKAKGRAERERDQLRAMLGRVKALADDWRMMPDRDRTHSMLCHQWHPDCLVMLIRAALEDPS